LLYDDAEKSYSFSFTPSTCQFRSRLDGSFPRTTPRFDTIIPAGRTGWSKLYAQNEQAIVGAVLNRNANVASSNAAFNGGHLLHKLTTATSAKVTLPVFPPSC
jgi:hypothetical protein